MERGQCISMLIQIYRPLLTSELSDDSGSPRIMYAIFPVSLTASHPHLRQLRASQIQQVPYGLHLRRRGGLSQKQGMAAALLRRMG